MRHFIVPLFVCFFISFTQTIQAKKVSHLQCLGTYTNQVFSMQDTDPHSTGYTIDLFRKNDQVIGRFMYINGLEGEPLIHAIFKESTYHPTQGTLTFSVRVNQGLPQNEHRSDKITLTFTGELKGNTLKGHLTQHDQGYPDSPKTSESLVLTKQQRQYDECANNNYVDYLLSEPDLW